MVYKSDFASGWWPKSLWCRWYHVFLENHKMKGLNKW